MIHALVMTIDHCDPRGTRVTSKTGLANLLRGCLPSGESTIGDGGRYKGAAWILIALPSGTARLNADTTRAAVQRYLDYVSRHGAEIPWQVVANRNGRINRVFYAAIEDQVRGWHCYLVRELAAEGEL
jgi:hypothetical protein